MEDEQAGSAKFELTDKSIDFLGFRLLRHLLGSLGRSSFGRHETAHFATGVEAYQATKEYEFGDTLNLDISSTLLHAVGREGLGVPLNLEYNDLMVRQAEYESSCSTVLLRKSDRSRSGNLYSQRIVAFPSRGFQNKTDGRREPLPVGLFSLQIFAPRRSQRIELRAAIVVRLAPLGLDPSALLKAMEGGIQRSLIPLQHFLRHLADALGDAPSVHGFKRKGLEDQEVQCPLHQVGWFAHSPSSVIDSTVHACASSCQ